MNLWGMEIMPCEGLGDDVIIVGSPHDLAKLAALVPLEPWETSEEIARRVAIASLGEHT